MTGITSRDVARSLGISQSTVSRAFTAGASISPGLRARIHAAAEGMGYRPNFLARGLVAAQSRLIGMVIAPQTNLLHPELIYELSRQLADRDRQLLLLPAQDEAAAAAAVDRLRAYRVDAVIATGIIGTRAARAIVADGVRLVTFNRLYDGVAGVSCDFAAGAATVARRLLDAGHRAFGYVGGPAGSWVSATALDGLRAGVSSVPGTTLVATAAPYAYPAAAAALAELRDASGRLPTAILCVNDTVAAGCLDHLRYGLGLAVPGDVALATFLGVAAGAWAGYELTGLAQPTARLVDAAVAMLTDADDGAGDGPHRLYRPDLVDGATAFGR